MRNLLLLSICALALQGQTYIVNHPDRRPLRAVYLSTFSYSNLQNPRGYNFAHDAGYDITTDNGTYSTFQSLASTYFAGVISQINAAAIKPQGVIIWDIEGQEFVQSTSYIGDPRMLGAGYAPEMNAAVDAIVSQFQTAGYSVGFTIRPEYIQPVTSLPGTCIYSSTNDYNEYYLLTTASFGNRFYACNSGGTSYTLYPIGFNVGTPTDQGGQTFYPQSGSSISQITALLSAKVAYARTRWGAKMFYVDTTVYHSGTPRQIEEAIFQSLTTTYPDTVFLPEESIIPDNYASTMPYSEPTAGGSALPTMTSRGFYPLGVLGVNVSNCSALTGTGQCWPNNVAGFTAGVTIGDINIYSMPSQLSGMQIMLIESMINAGLTQAAQVVVTDTSTSLVYNYTGYPATIYTPYPVKMRIYFATSDAGLPTSTTFCESGQVVGTNTCSLNLSGLVRAQMQYYDFQNNLVATGPSFGTFNSASSTFK